MVRVAARSRRINYAFLARQNETESAFGPGDPINIGRAFLALTRRTIAEPAKMMRARLPCGETPRGAFLANRPNPSCSDGGYTPIEDAPGSYVMVKLK